LAEQLKIIGPSPYNNPLITGRDQRLIVNRSLIGFEDIDRYSISKFFRIPINNRLKLSFFEENLVVDNKSKFPEIYITFIKTYFSFFSAFSPTNCLKYKDIKLQLV
jgi:hypothetical protein